MEFLNIKQKDVSQAIGMSSGHLSKFLQGKGKVTPEALGKIILHYNVDPLWLLGTEGDDKTPVFTVPVIPKAELEKVVESYTDKLIKTQEELNKMLAENRDLYKKLYEMEEKKNEQLVNDSSIYDNK